MSFARRHPAKKIAAVVLFATLGSTTGCVSTGSMSSFWSGMNPTNWFARKSDNANALTQKSPPAAAANPSTLGATSRLGAGPAKNGWLTTATAPLTKNFTVGDPPTNPSDDALRLDVQPKHLNPQLYVQVARAFEAKGDFASAIKQYEQALKVAPNSVDVLLGLARAYDRQGNHAQAIATYEQTLKLDPNNGTVHNDLGLCFARHNETSRALEELMKACNLAPTSQLYRNNLATVLVQQGRYEEALQQLLAVLPEPAAHYNLGYLAERNGNRAMALQHFQQAATLDPNLQAARQMIDKLQATAAQIPSVESMQTRVHEASAQAQQSAAQQMQNAELKIRNAIQSQTSAIAPRYADPIQPPSDTYSPTAYPSTGASSELPTPPNSNAPQPLPPLEDN